jgi:hypothetical protein
MINIIKTLIYKENPNIYDKIDIDNDFIFSEPLLFAYFNEKKHKNNPVNFLEEILQGYFTIPEKTKTTYSTNKHGIAYIPNVGYFKNENKIKDIVIIPNTKIELLYYPIIHLNYIYKDLNDNLLDIQKIEESNELVLKNENFLYNAFNFIKQSIYHHFELIEENCKKIVLFKTKPENTNSFATINAQGIAFFNVYQEEYDEVFFVDDIAHQTGHIIMTNVLFERKVFFIIDENENIGAITKDKKEYRSFYILFHALYTYYTTILCLEACLKNNCFNEKQEHEAIGRIVFYLEKYKYDLIRFQEIIKYYKGIENVLKPKANEIYSNIYDLYQIKSIEYDKEINNYNFSNQTYNFSYKLFTLKNKPQCTK